MGYLGHIYILCWTYATCYVIVLPTQMEIFSHIIGNYYGSDWVGMTLMCISIYLLGNQHRFGFVIGIGSCIGWFIFGILTRSIPDMLAQVIIVVMHTRGYLRWKITS